MATNWSFRAKEVMRERKISQEVLAQGLGCSRAAVGHYLAGRRQPGLDLIQLIAQALEVDPSWLMFGGDVEAGGEQGAEPDAKLTPTGLTVVGTTRPEGPIQAQRVKLPGLTGSSYLLRVTGSDLAPRAYEGEYLLLDQETRPRPGDEVLVRDHDGKPSFRIYLRDDGEKVVFTLLDDQTRREERSLSEFSLMHPVLAIWRWVTAMD